MATSRWLREQDRKNREFEENTERRPLARAGAMVAAVTAPVIGLLAGDAVVGTAFQKAVQAGDTAAADALIERLQRGELIKERRKQNNEGIIFVTRPERVALTHTKDPTEQKLLNSWGAATVDARDFDKNLQEMSQFIRSNNESMYVPRDPARRLVPGGNHIRLELDPSKPATIRNSWWEADPKNQYIFSHFAPNGGKPVDFNASAEEVRRAYTNFKSDPSIVMHELGHATGALGRPGKLSDRWRKVVGYSRRAAQPVSLIPSIGISGRAVETKDPDELKKLDTENAAVHIASGALHAPLLAEEARASVRALRMGKKHNIKVSPGLLAKAYGTYVNAAVTPTALTYLTTRALINHRRKQLEARKETEASQMSHTQKTAGRHDDLFNEYIPEETRRELLARRIREMAGREEMRSTVPLASSIIGAGIGGLAVGGKERTLKGSLIGAGVGALAGGGLGLYRQHRHNSERHHARGVLAGGEDGLDHELERLRADYAGRRRADAQATMD